MTVLEIGGLVGVAMMAASYAGVQFEKLSPTGWAVPLANLVGAGLVLLSMIDAFNLPAFIMESIWALIAIAGLAKLVFRRRP